MSSENGGSRTPPLSEDLVEALIEALWVPAQQRGEEVYALVDGARDGRIYERIRRSGLDHRCLLGRGLEPSLARTAPYLVSLGRRSLFTRELLAEGWGRGWGLFLASEAVLQQLVRHFRRFLDVRDPGGRSLMLRLWDPRVVRSFLPVCTREELAFLFGPIGSFSIEVGNGDRLQRLLRIEEGEVEGYLEEEIVRLSSAGPEVVSKSLVAGNLRGPDPARSRDRLFRLRQPHWEALQRLARESFVDHTLRLIARSWPHTCRSRGDSEIRRFVRRGIATAGTYGVTGRRSVLHFLNLQLALGEDFHRLPWAVELLDREDLRGATRISLLRERAERVMAAECG